MNSRQTVNTQSAEYYDAMFHDGGYGRVFDLPYWHSCYYPLFRAVLKDLRRINAGAVLEVGCGTGAFAHLLFDRTSLGYVGFDFSAVAVERARRRTGVSDRFFVGNALERANYEVPHDTIVCTEVLEHIGDDLGVIKNWSSGMKCVCSVPNFGAESHVRHFRSETEVLERYGSAIAIERIVRIKKPVLPDISWRNYLRALRWNRNRPKRLLEIASLASFDTLGGWFLFCGVKH